MRLSDETLDKLIKSYFDMRFKDARLVKINIGEYRGWYGFVIGDETKRGDYRMILGTDSLYDFKYRMWYNDGSHFSGGRHIFGLSIDEFNRAMKRYINNLYPELQIVDLS